MITLNFAKYYAVQIGIMAAANLTPIVGGAGIFFVSAIAATPSPLVVGPIIGCGCNLGGLYWIA